jgi:ATP-dependent DNA helicase Q1
VTPKNKELIHRSWMRNETQVVVATIAFGLGINKPDVYVLYASVDWVTVYSKCSPICLC